jgi:hypothetical protein
VQWPKVVLQQSWADPLAGEEQLCLYSHTTASTFCGYGCVQAWYKLQILKEGNAAIPLIKIVLHSP